MIIVKVPFRLPVGGGGTDLPAYANKHGGLLITASINKYMYISINRPVTGNKIKIYYKYAEQVDVDKIDDIQHNIIREALKLYKINYPLEIGSMADIEAQTGMGSSSVFTVGLIAGLNVITKRFMSPQEVAEMAFKIEVDLVGKQIGKQDQYAASLGGINQLYISPTGHVSIVPVVLPKETIYDLENRLMMFHTPIKRDANEVIASQSDNIKTDELVLKAMHEIKSIGMSIKYALDKGDIDSFGKLLNSHWLLKKTMSEKMSDTFIDNVYDIALKTGALGGKIMGAGGGGLFLFCIREGINNRKNIKDAMEALGLTYMDFRFEFDGAKVIVNQ